VKRCRFAFYNLAPAGDPMRGEVFVQRELTAIANFVDPESNERKRPKVLGVCEAVGRALPPLDRFNLLRSREDASKANVALYVRDDLRHGEPRWIMHGRRWPNILRPGLHDPRATLVVKVENWRVVVAHAPQAPREVFPVATREALDAARDEWLDIMLRLLDRSGPVLLLSDPNGLAGQLKQRMQALNMEGGLGEAVHAMGANVKHFQMLGEANGVAMLSDHHQFELGRARLPS
jgi:hypothetical protein